MIELQWLKLKCLWPMTEQLESAGVDGLVPIDVDADVLVPVLLLVGTLAKL